MKYDCGSSITFRVPGSTTAVNAAVVAYLLSVNALCSNSFSCYCFRMTVPFFCSYKLFQFRPVPVSELWAVVVTGLSTDWSPCCRLINSTNTLKEQLARQKRNGMKSSNTRCFEDWLGCSFLFLMRILYLS